MSSPIATTSAAVTRNAETFGLADTSLVDLSQGTLYVELEAPDATGAVGMIVCVRTTGPAVVVECFSGTSPPVTNHIRSATISGLVMDGDTSYTPSSGEIYRAAFAWSDGDSAAAYSANLGGNLETSSDAVSIAGPISFIGFGNNNGGQQLYGYLRYVEYRPARDDDGTLQAWAQST